MSEKEDGPWEPATEHDELGDDPATMPATLAQHARARAARSHALPVTPGRERPEATLPPPGPERLPATPVTAVTGGIIVVASGSEVERVRGLCHAHDLTVPVVTSVANVPDTAASVIVIGDASPPAHDRVVYAARSMLPDDMLLALVRAAAAGRSLAQSSTLSAQVDTRVADYARQLSALDDRAAIETLAIEAITACTTADRAYVWFHDVVRHALWSEAARRGGAADRQPTSGIVGWSAVTGEHVHASPAGDDPRFVLDADDPGGKPQARLLVHPVLGANGRVYAVLVAARRWRRVELTDADRTALHDLAILVAPAFERLAASDVRRPRVTSSGMAALREASEAAVQSAIVGGRRGTGDSRPPPVTARPGDSRPPPVAARPGDSRPPPVAPRPSDSRPPPLTTRPHDSRPQPLTAPPDDSRPPATTSGNADLALASLSAHDATSVPSPTTPDPVSRSARAATSSAVGDQVVTRPPSEPASASAPALRAATPLPVTPVPARAGSEPSAPGEHRSRKASDPPRARRASSEAGEPRDLAVVASAPANIARVQKLARKARLEVSVLARVDDAPPYYRVVTLGEAPDPAAATRIAYAARATLSDDMLIELLVGLQNDCAPTVLVATPPQSTAEARRLQLAIASARKLSAAHDLAEAETIATAAIRELVDAERAYCLYFDAAVGSLWSETRERERGDDRRAIAGIVGWVARAGRPVSAPRASADPRWLGPLDDPGGDPNSQLLAYPIIAADRRVLGVMVAVRPPKRPGFTELDVRIFERFVALAAPQLEQLELARDAREVLGDSDAVEGERPAPPSALQQLARRAEALPRWVYAVGGGAVAFAVATLARC